MRPSAAPHAQSPRAFLAAYGPWLLWGAVILLAIHTWAYKSQEDFRVFHTAGARFLGGEPLYRDTDGLMPFKYAPVVALLFAPLGLLPERAASLVWLLASCAMLWRFVRLSAELFTGRASPGREALVVLLVLPFVRHHFAVGQCDLALFWLSAESLRLAPRRPWLSGALLSWVCLVKPPFLLFLGTAVLLLQARRVAGFAVGLVLGLGASALRYGLEGNLAQLMRWRQLLSQSTPDMLCAVDNESVWGMACAWVSPPGQPAFLAAVAVGSLLVVGAFAAALLRLRRERPTEAEALLHAAAFYLTAFLSPLGWRTALLGLVPLLFLLLQRREAFTPPWLRALALAVPLSNALAGMLLYDVAGRAAFLFYLGHKVMAALALATALLAVVALLRSAPAPVLAREH
jgi:hypothetical protein